MNYPRYPEYKPSGVEWLGEVPVHWEIDRMKWSVTGCQNGIWGAEPDGVDDIVCVRVADFDRQRFSVILDQPTLRTVTEKERKGRVLANGDLLIEKSGGGELQPVGVVVNYVRDEPAVCSNFVARMPIAEQHDSRYWTYLHAHLYSGRVNVRSIKQTTGIQNLDSSMYLNEVSAYPPYQEQRAISAFLDRETMCIDALIAKKQQLIELLAEKRTALISQAVTKGLNPDAPMKDSGVEWLGEIPVHWDVVRVKFVAKLESGHTPSKQIPEYWENCDIPWVSLNDSKQLAACDYISETKYQISKLGLENSSAHVLPTGAVVFTRDATIGLAAITTKEMAVSQHLIAWIPNSQIRAEYLLRVFNVMKAHLDSYTFGATIKTIGMPDVKKLVTTLPPLDEQKAIEEYVRTKANQLEKLASAVDGAIGKLQEYRSAVIANAVTGKIDVRGLVQEREVA